MYLLISSAEFDLVCFGQHCGLQICGRHLVIMCYLFAYKQHQLLVVVVVCSMYYEANNNLSVFCEHKNSPIIIKIHTLFATFHSTFHQHYKSCAAFVLHIIEIFPKPWNDIMMSFDEQIAYPTHLWYFLSP